MISINGQNKILLKPWDNSLIKENNIYLSIFLYIYTFFFFLMLFWWLVASLLLFKSSSMCNLGKTGKSALFCWVDTVVRHLLHQVGWNYVGILADLTVNFVIFENMLELIDFCILSFHLIPCPEPSAPG